LEKFDLFWTAMFIPDKITKGFDAEKYLISDQILD